MPNALLDKISGCKVYFTPKKRGVTSLENDGRRGLKKF